MGDRSTAYLTKRNTETGILEHWLCLYWHSAGVAAHTALARALKAAEGRWNDDSYGTAQLLAALFKGHCPPSGCPIGDFDDNSYEVIEIDWNFRRVLIWSPTDHANLEVLNDVRKAQGDLSFHQFIQRETALKST